MSYTGPVPEAEPGRAWLTQAACRADGVDADTFFHDNNAVFIAAARAICGPCPVRRQCLADCMRDEDGRSAKSRFGVYAGLTPRQRERLYHKHRNQSKKPAAQQSKPAPKKRKPADTKCGTRGGYQKHVRERTEICGPCRKANSDADNRLRRTGTTKAAA